MHHLLWLNLLRCFIVAPPPPPLQLSSVLAGMHHLVWLNLPMVRATLPVLPLLNKLPSLEQLFLQVREGEGRVCCFVSCACGGGGGGVCVCVLGGWVVVEVEGLGKGVWLAHRS